MAGYILRRVLLIIPVIVGAVTILFAAFFVLPGDTVALLAGSNSGKSVPENVRANIEKSYGLDQPLVVQYGRYWKNLLHGDLGTSYKTNESVNDILKRKAPLSIKLAIWAILIEIVVGIATGILSAVKKYSFLDAFATLGTTAALAIPAFVLGYLLQWLFAVYSFQQGWPSFLQLEAQATDMPNTWTLFFIPTGDQWKYLILPAITLACVSTAVVARLTRSTMLEAGSADYIRTARAKGASERRVVFKHTLRNALIPVVTLIGLDFGTVIGAAVLTETVFGWNGIGSQIAISARGRDAPVVIGLTLVVVIAYAIINLLVDLSYGVLDPRIRYGEEAST